MARQETDPREALRRIAQIAGTALRGAEDHVTVSIESRDNDESPASDGETPGRFVPDTVCTPKSLPKRLLQRAARTAIQLNPVNAPLLAQAPDAGISLPSHPAFISVVTSKYWGPQARRFTVSFMDGGSPALRSRILSHMNAWSQTSGISCVETKRDGQIRIARASSGYWSYLGTDVLLIPRNRQTMNLQGFTMNTPESEYRRVIRHEMGHSLGFPHEHMRQALVDRIDPQKAYEYFLRTQGWDQQMVDQQVLTSLDELSLMSTPPDQTSIMCYQLPGSITKDGQPILGGMDINATDATFAGKIYPKPRTAAARSAMSLAEYLPAAVMDEEEWPESEDVTVDLSQLEPV
jgi:hypothetical protein